MIGFLVVLGFIAFVAFAAMMGGLLAGSLGEWSEKNNHKLDMEYRERYDRRTRDYYGR